MENGLQCEVLRSQTDSVVLSISKCCLFEPLKWSYFSKLLKPPGFGPKFLPCLNTISKSPPPSLAIYSAGDLIGAGVGGAPATKCRVGSPAGGRGVEGGRGGLNTHNYILYRPLLSEYTHAGHLQDKVAHKCACTACKVLEQWRRSF